MLTIKAEVQRDKQRSDGTYNVKVRFTLNRNVRRLSTSLFVTSKELTKSFKFREEACLCCLLSEDLLSGSLLHSSFVMQIPIE